MLGRHPNMRAADAALQPAPERFNGVGMMDTVCPHLVGVVYRAMHKAEVRQVGVDAPFVRADGRAGLDVARDLGFDVVAAAAFDGRCADVPATLDHAEDDLLVGNATLAARHATDPRFVGFDMTAKHGIAVNMAHVLANLVTDAPRRLVCHTNLALQFLGRYAVPRRGEQVHGIEPLLQGRAGPLKGRSLHRVNVMTAPGAGIGRKLAETCKPPFLAAFRAF